MILVNCCPFSGQEKYSLAPTVKRCALLRFSKTERQILAMWMAGENTKAICAHLNIKDKTLLSHKINIKRKTNADNKQIIYYILKIAGSVTDDLYARLYSA
ncbi:MAG: LuxR C-terminal-related transcriptional regulator [Sodalis sp. (in: enterobacteria)]|uniref:LuxR C-terminal-related transcriptional regulator n=1 Tax=Sodalis sp. (in: enterobacteria) TaxID=1898979 RepID=UPI003F3DE1C5